MRRVRSAVLSVAVLIGACGDAEPPPPPGKGAQPDMPAAPPDGEPEGDAIPDHIVYDQILVAFKDSYRVTNPRTKRVEVLSDTDRPREAAQERAARVLDLARSGADFQALKEEYTDARTSDGEPSGLVHAARDGVPKETHEIYRGTLYPGPSAVIFKLKVGEVGMVEHDPKRCPDGWLIVKRVR
ncbi:MAG: peptidylprolyl isomerase [Planctomycetes bacterium]|nr:peptidylprolyl isomerase [Planctomycetota bacterium]